MCELYIGDLNVFINICIYYDFNNFDKNIIVEDSSLEKSPPDQFGSKHPIGLADKIEDSLKNPDECRISYYLLKIVLEDDQSHTFRLNMDKYVLEFLLIIY